jgi:catechol 2,3-dioxygenase-like lactoylglutathione lyase family enzyme
MMQRTSITQKRSGDEDHRYTPQEKELTMVSVRYMVRDVERAAAFYTQRLGFELAERWGPAFAIVRRGDLDLWLSGPATSAAKAMPDGRVPEPGGWNRIVVKVDDLEALHAQLTQAGAVFRNNIITGPGGSQVLVEDGEGNVVELFQRRG